MTGKLLDTTVLIDLSRGNAEAADFVDVAFNSETPLFISVISAMELIAGCRNKAEVEKAKKLVADFTLIHLTPIASAKAYTLMLAHSKSHGLAIPDALIASTAITQELELATDNDRHFKMIPELTVKRPYYRMLHTGPNIISHVGWVEVRDPTLSAAAQPRVGFHFHSTSELCSSLLLGLKMVIACSLVESGLNYENYKFRRL